MANVKKLTGIESFYEAVKMGRNYVGLLSII